MRVCIRTLDLIRIKEYKQLSHAAGRGKIDLVLQPRGSDPLPVSSSPVFETHMDFGCRRCSRVTTTGHIERKAAKSVTLAILIEHKAVYRPGSKRLLTR